MAERPGDTAQLDGLFSAAEDTLRASLRRIRCELQHHGNKGTAAEAALRKFLQQHLPRRYSIGQGEVIDSAGRRSAQTDVVITDEDHPHLTDESGPGLYFIDGVAAAGEVKAVLTSKNLEMSLSSSQKYKRLLRHHSAGDLAVGNSRGLRHYAITPPMFLFAYESEIPLASVLARAQAFRRDNSLANHATLDAVFLLGKGAVFDLGEGDEVLQLLNDGEQARWWTVHSSLRVLQDMVVWITASAPRTVRLQSYLPFYYRPARRQPLPSSVLPEGTSDCSHG